MNQEKFDLVREAISEAAKTDDERLIMSYRITPETKLPPMQPLFKMFDTPCFYRGELVAACGKAKSGKTLFLSILMAACLTDKVLALKRLTDVKPLRVLWIDTEQSQQSTQDIMVNRILPLSKESEESVKSMAPNPSAISVEIESSEESVKSVASNPSTISVEIESSEKSVQSVASNLFAFNLRGLGFEKRREVVEAAIRHVRPDIVIIDGIKDLITDINDAVQATQIMEHLMALAQRGNCCIVNVLHQNKSEADRNMRGSIGTELTNKAFEVYECEYLERHKLFRVTQTLSRRQRMSHRLCYVLSKEGLPEACDEPQEQPRDMLGRWVSTKTKSEALVKLFNEAMEGRTQRKYSELMAVALKKCGVADAQAYYALVKEAEEQGIIRKAIHPDTKESWVELNDDSVLPF